MRKYMKNYKIVGKAICCALSLFLFNGCSLDEKLYDTVTQDDIKTQADMELMIKGVYAEFNDASAFKFWGPQMMLLCADDMYGTKVQCESFGKKKITGTLTESFWNNMYRTIRHSAYIFKYVNELETLDEGFRKQAVGEASFLRGLAYYYLVRFYGGVPLRLDDVNIGSDFFLPRNSVEEVYEQIFRDLTVANYSLPLANEFKSDDLGRASKGAAQALLASAHLTYGNYLENRGKTDFDSQYKQVVAWSDSILVKQVPSVYQLVNNYADLWDVAKEMGAYKEVLFGIRFSRDPLKSLLGSSGSELAFRTLPDNLGGVTGNSTGTPAGNGENNIMFHPYFYNYYFTNPTYSKANTTWSDLDADYRLQTSFLTRWINANNGKQINAYPWPVVDEEAKKNIALLTGQKLQPFLAKYMDGQGKDNRNHENDLFLIRLAEIYLIKAEALNELYGPTPEAIAAFNTVRERARKADGAARQYPALLTADQIGDKTDFRMKIFDERGLEFVGEGARWFDLVRMKHPTEKGKTMHDYRFAEFLDEAKYPRGNPVFDKAKNTWTNPAIVWAYVSEICTSLGSGNRFVLFPIPGGEIDNNPNINFSDQNPGW